MSILLEILECFDETGEEIARRIPAEGSADIKFGAQLIVRESQEAIFYTGGQARDRFGPGRHTLRSENLPLLTAALSLPWGFKSPFRCEVYFVHRKTFTQLRWGTPEPVVFRDENLGYVRLRAHGLTSFRVVDADTLIRDLIGTQGVFTVQDATDYLRNVIVARLNDFLGENLKSVFDLPALYDEMGDELRAKLRPDFGRYGLELVDFFITSITPPAEVQNMVDARGGISLVGDDMGNYMQYQAARSLGKGDANGGGVGTGMLDAGVGLGMGMALSRQVADGLPGPGPRSTPAAAYCVQCGHGLQATDRFCGQCGRARADSPPPPATPDPGTE